MSEVKLECYKCDLEVLAALFSRKGFPAEKKTDITTIKASKKRKRERTAFCSIKKQYLMRDAPQNSKLWYLNREGVTEDVDPDPSAGGSYGGSGHAALSGYDKYNDNTVVWQRETGRLAKGAPKDYSEVMPLDHGHYWEA